jgi:hypothetical protein
MTQTKLLSVLFIASAAAILVSVVIQNSAMADQYSRQKQGYSHHDNIMMMPGSYAFGTIASLQNDENGNPL